ncbi:unnamed protein product [Parajaminaea phylloscopi]
MPHLPPLLVDIPRNPILAVGLPVGLGVATGLLTRKGKYGPDSVWYKSLNKPRFDPPKWAFGVVWPALYAAMGYSSHLIVKTLDRTPPGLGRQQVSRALSLYYLQLALNQAWTPLNFGLGNLTVALIDLVALTSTLGLWVTELKDVNEKAFWLTLPYLAWSTYATYLNGSLWWHNVGSNWVAKLQGKVQKKSK